jgi:transcription antitermination factor NusG
MSRRLGINPGLIQAGWKMYEDPWHVLHVIANHEKRVAQHLAVRSVEHYVPLYRMRSQWSDRSVQLERPLFAGYVFVRFSPRERLSVISTPGVLHLLGDSAGCEVSCAELDRIRQALAGGYTLLPHPWLEVGTRVRVRGGVFDGVEGVVTELRRQCSVIIELAAIRQCFSLEIGIDQVERVATIPGGAVHSPSPRAGASRRA